MYIILYTYYIVLYIYIVLCAHNLMGPWAHKIMIYIYIYIQIIKYTIKPINN